MGKRRLPISIQNKISRDQSYPRSVVRPIAIALALIVGAVVPTISFTPATLTLATLMCIYSIAAYGVAFLWRGAGSVSMAHGGLWAVGAYASALLAAHLGWPLIADIVPAAVAAALAAALIGLPTGRISGQYFVIVTFVAVEIITTLTINLGSITGGDTGMFVNTSAVIIPRLLILRSVFQWYLAVYVILIVVVVILSQIRRSRFGFRLSAVRENEILAKSVGIHTTHLNVLAFCISGAACGLSGALWAFFEHYVQPSQFGAGASLMFLEMIILGGLMFTLGPFVGSILVIGLPVWLPLSPTGGQILLGVLLIVFILAFPGGVLSSVELISAAGRRIRGIPVRSDPAVELTLNNRIGDFDVASHRSNPGQNEASK